MNQGARVHSVDSLRDFRTTLCNFGTEAGQAMAAVEGEIQHTMDWLTHDQLKHWQHQVRRCEDAVNEAKSDLHRAQLAKNAAGETPSCMDQKKALQKAKERLAFAEEKVEKCKHWSRVMDQEVSEYRGPSQQLLNALEGDLPQAYAWLDRIVASLEAYADLAPPSEGPVVVESAAVGSVAPAAPVVAAPPAASQETP